MMFITLLPASFALYHYEPFFLISTILEVVDSEYWCLSMIPCLLF